MPEEKITLKYNWRRKWPDEDDKFSGFDGKWLMGYIGLHHMGYWTWGSGLSEYEKGPALHGATGMEPTARAAAKAVENCYERMLAGDWPGMSDKVRARAMSLAGREGRKYG
ncbi:hypothetical protein EPK99_06310 [Neorhizobium lilium]|uniref:Uncharacterized protein n=1 Tax=Neorhizobium lilium TaxID=2503024 RepID=A0A3S3TZ96_9HYPH|nr:hypothetical protein [Neorhizobium lilium]RWX78245.1 hypothetical protein EPK99_06310 [Neorhizobium lilium]